VRLALILATAAAGLLIAPQANAQAREAYFGRYNTRCGVPDVSGKQGGEGPASPSSVTAATNELLLGFIRAAAKGAPTEAFLDRSRLPDETLVSCASAIAKLQSSSDCKMIPFYLLGDEEIRAEWLCKGKSAYMAFFTVADGKISNIWAMDHNNMPPIVISGS
jgi:hypothetical protein